MSIIIIIIINRKLMLLCFAQVDLHKLQWWYDPLYDFVFIELCDTTSVFMVESSGHTQSYSVPVIDGDTHPFVQHFFGNCGPLAMPFREGKGPPTVAHDLNLAYCPFLYHL